MIVGFLGWAGLRCWDQDIFLVGLFFWRDSECQTL